MSWARFILNSHEVPQVKYCLSRTYSVIKKTEYGKESLEVRVIYVNCQWVEKVIYSVERKKKDSVVMMNFNCAISTNLR
jgi:4-hydroxy-3-methylbut-2-enyl diphosphate reductase IspH